MVPPSSRLRVDVATGATRLDAIDLVLPGPIPLVLSRHYHSASSTPGSLGPGWRLGLDVELAVSADRITCEGGPFDGAAFAPVEPGRAAVQEATGLILEHLGDAYLLFASPTRQLVFLKRHARGERVPLAAIRSGTGQAIQIERRSGRIAEVRDPLGRTLRVTARGDAIDGIDLIAPGAQPVAVARYTYANGHLRSAAGVDGRPEQFEVDGRFLTTHLRRAGDRTYAQYAEDGRCLALWGDGGGAVHLAYDDLRQATRVLDASGGQTIYRHVGGQQVLERIDPGGASHNYYYDEASRLIGHGNAQSVVAFQRLDPGERRLAHLHREERIAFVQYGENGLAEAVEDAFENTYRLRWNEAHALTQIETPEDDTWTFQRDDAGRITAIASPEGRTARLAWERNRLTVEDAEGTRRRDTFDALGRLTERLDRSGRRETRRYGPDGNLAEIRWGEDYALELLHDADGRLVGTADSERQRVRIERDPAGRIVGQSDAAGAVRLERDALGRILSVSDGQGAPLRLEYDADGRLSRLTGRVDATYVYADGRTEVRDAAGTRRYGVAGDLVEWARLEDDRQAFQCGPSGHLLSWEHTRGDQMLGSLYPEYDASGRLIGLSGVRAGDGGHAADVEARFQHDRDGCLAELHDADGPVLQITPDALGRPVELAGLETPVRLTYDAADRIATVEAGDRRLELAYDALDRVVAVRTGETTHDLRASAEPVVEALASSVSLRAERRGVLVLAHLGGLAVPVRVQAERRCPLVSATVQRVACAIRGPGAVLPPPAAGEALLALWSAAPHRDLQLDHAAVPRARDLGLEGDVLDAFFLGPSHLEAVPMRAGGHPAHQLDDARDPHDALTGAHRRGPLRPAPWRERAARLLLPPPDLLAPDGSPSARDAIAFLRHA